MSACNLETRNSQLIKQQHCSTLHPRKYECQLCLQKRIGTEIFGACNWNSNRPFAVIHDTSIDTHSRAQLEQQHLCHHHFLPHLKFIEHPIAAFLVERHREQHCWILNTCAHQATSRAANKAFVRIENDNNKMASKCTIIFDNNPLGVYYAGQTVSGVAELITTRPKTIRCGYNQILTNLKKNFFSKYFIDYKFLL